MCNALVSYSWDRRHKLALNVGNIFDKSHVLGMSGARFAQMGDEASQAFQNFARAVKDGSFPSYDESYPMDEDERAQMDHGPFASPPERS